MKRVLALTAMAAVFGVAAPAHGDPSSGDAGFLEALKGAGITYQNPEGAVADGKAMCKLLDAGKSGRDIVTELSHSNPALPERDAAKFLVLSAVAYCPKYMQVAKDSNK